MRLLAKVAALAMLIVDALANNFFQEKYSSTMDISDRAQTFQTDGKSFIVDSDPHTLKVLEWTGAELIEHSTLDVSTVNPHNLDYLAVNDFDGTIFLATGSSLNWPSREVSDNAVMIWKWESSQFVKFQNIRSSVTWSLQFGQFSGQRFLVVSRGPGTSDKNGFDIYKFANSEFELLAQNFADMTVHAGCAEFYEENAEFFLAIGNALGPSDSHWAYGTDRNSRIYKWSNDAFELFQELTTPDKLSDVTAINIPSQPVLVAATSYLDRNYAHTHSATTIFTADESGTSIVQVIPKYDGMSPYASDTAKLGADTLLAIAYEQDDYQDGVVLVLYRWAGQGFVFVEEVCRIGGLYPKVLFATHAGKPYLIAHIGRDMVKIYETGASSIATSTVTVTATTVTQTSITNTSTTTTSTPQIWVDCSAHQTWGIAVLASLMAHL